jgi:4-hydroxybenzoate polyprenyltransferase
MTERIHAVWRLTRFQEYAFFVIITTLLGAAAGHGSLGWPLLVVLVANWLAVGFAFMVNDVEDAPDDAMTPAKAQRNPVSSGDLSPRFAWLLSFTVAFVAAALYASLGLGPFVTGLVCVVLAYLYSSRRVRLKATPVADLASHALLLAGLQFLAAYLTFDGGTVAQWASPLVLVLAISLYGQLFNELRDFDGDLKAGITHTASILGRRAAHSLMIAWLLIGVASAIVSILIVRLIPVWVILLTVALAVLLSWRRLPRGLHAQSTIERHKPFQKPVEIAAAISLLAWFAGPWAPSLISRIAVANPW